MAKYDRTKIHISIERLPRKFEDLLVSNNEAFTIDLSGVGNIGDA